MLTPLMVSTSVDPGSTRVSSCRMRFVFVENLVRWMVAPNSESIKDPTKPPKAPQNKKSRSRIVGEEKQAELSMISVIDIVNPMITPPATDANVPSDDTPPFVPGGTRLQVVINNGADLERIPSSEAIVSPRQHAKCPKVANNRKRLQP